MSLKAAIQAKDEAAVVKAVEKAVKIYGADAPDEAILNSAYGDVPFSLVFDEDTKWAAVTAAYVEVTQAVARIPKGADVKVETAKIIAQNKVLRSVGTTGAAGDASGLL